MNIIKMHINEYKRIIEVMNFNNPNHILSAKLLSAQINQTMNDLELWMNGFELDGDDEGINQAMILQDQCKELIKIIQTKMQSKG